MIEALRNYIPSKHAPTKIKKNQAKEKHPRINAWSAAAAQPLETSASQLESLHQNFLRGTNIAGDQPFLGTRPITNKIPGPYIWQTYNEIHKRVKNFGIGLLATIPALSSTVQSAIGIFSINRAEWIIAEQSCFFTSLTTVPLFDMYSNAAVRHIVMEASLSVIIATRDKAAMLLSMAETDTSLQCLKYIIIMDASAGSVVDEDVAAVGEEFGIEVLAMLDVERRGAMAATSAVLAEVVRPGKDTVASICYTSGKI
ncbi:Long-chain-fatty-acid--CoA ligase 6 [Physocladia obscura]|uniref:Long-chain-fatty-acid--CoA ligase 6 n=1 Tax=Physocladia obscura TaxID=109957 RepID=A0AAD5T2D7_9FUNG|nr:Long-chain-fatty-acid--CoA ligase 6 [Physocladia obscura]